MTVSYAGEVPNGSSFGCFWKILFKWRGSVYKLVWRELLAYLALYYSINLLYRYGLNDDQKRIFEKLRQYFGAQGESIPMSFVLGFYVTLVVNRWWAQYKLLPWPDTLALVISAAISTSAIDKKEQGRLMRRNIMRYMVLSFVITLMRISLRVKKRFPSWQHLVDSGLMLESEKKIFEIMDQKSPMSKYWMPLVWATNIINTARKQELITSDHIVQTLLVELSDIRRRLGALIGYDTVCVPLVYTQVVTLVLYTYFIAALLGRQMIPTVDLPTGTKYEDPDLYFPLFTVLQFVFYVGWLKVAEVLINPFGEDDDDIELNWLIDRHIKASYMIVDEMHEEHPELLRDQYWDEIVPKELPYTVGSEHYRKHEPKGSAEHYKVKQNDALYANISTAKGGEDVYADYESVDTPMVERRKNWFSRQISRMGSVRSSSTAYSSGGVFKRNRNNSVYANPEAVLPGQTAQPPAHKMSLYEKFVSRKSDRQNRQFLKQNSKLNLNGAFSTAPQKNRPRIPTPDVSNDKENRFNLMPTPSSHPSNNPHSMMNIAESVALATRKLATEPSVYPTPTKDDTLPIATLQLSPITEMDSGSVNNTLNTNSPTTAELARSVVIPTVTSSSSFAEITNTPSMMRVTLFPKVTNGTSPSHEVSVSIQTMPVNSSPSTPSNVIITEIPSDTMDDEVDGIRGRPLSRQSSSLSAAPHVGRMRTISDASNKSPVPGRQNVLGNSSAPSTLKKSTPEQKTGEVYV
ncbi:hypothetical protein HA402_001871 [Bradysia odoriphaga]|nr:hypothetical protein HA402_001871 [Bradysia odoriphaga]